MYQSFTLQYLLDRPHLSNVPASKRQYNKAVQVKSTEADKKYTEDLQKRHKAVREERKISSESTFTLTSEMDSQNVGHSSTFTGPDSGQSTRAGVADFFKRPVHLTELAISAGVTTEFNPYTSWFNQPTVRAKLRNYAFFRGNMTLHFVLTSSAYHYGTVLLSHQPHPLRNMILEHYLTNGFGTPPMQSYLSQSPEKGYLRLGKDSELKLQIPMVLPNQCIRLKNEDFVVGSATSFPDTVDLAEMYVSVLSFGSTSPEPDTVYMQVYGWFDDVELGPLTATPLILAESQFETMKDNINSNSTLNKVGDLVSGQVSDEYSEAGPITKIASAVSTISSKFMHIPYIGPAARATALASKAAASVFNFFGFSRPSLIEPPCYAKVVQFNNGCVTTNKDTAFKLTHDPKQELSIQPLGGEGGFDPMAINFLTSRESFLGKMNWTDNQLPLVSNIGFLPVTPMLVSNPSDRFRQMSAMASAAYPFRNWRGTISYRLQIECSPLARGKFLIIYEPNAELISTLAIRGTKLNEQYMVLVDITKTRDIIIDVGFTHNRLFARNDPAIWDSALDSIIEYEIGSLATPNLQRIRFAYNNGALAGMLHIRPYTDFVNPNSTSPCEILVYAWSNDLELANPISFSEVSNDIFNFASVESTKASSESMFVEDKDFGDTVNQTSGTGVSCPSFLINKVKPELGDSYLYHFGERITSFRSLMKRDHSNCVLPSTTLTDVLHVSLHPNIGRNFNPRPGIPAGPGDVQTKNIFNYLRWHYMYMKGGYRHRIPDYVNSGVFSVTKKSVEGFDIGSHYEALGTSQRFEVSNSGSLIIDTNHQGMEFELPDYNPALFHFSHWDNNLFYYAYDEHSVAEIVHCTGRTVNEAHVVSSAAEDFTFFRFQGGMPFLGVSF